MALPSGSFGPYEILAQLGAGGMGEVYRARDRRLGREVALKVLPAELSDDPGRLARFEQEARSASALSHPNIVTVYEIGRSDSTSFIAMELVEGRTLRELAAAEKLSVRRILSIATQIAEGLAKAHAAGIVHRDLKPDNVMVSKDGFVKILDFGLAKLIEPDAGDLAAMPTVARPETQPGTVLGTVAYMSPEQASARPVDFRSDQFSLGSILYELTAGKKPFDKPTAAQTMSAIIAEEQEPLARVRPDAPAPLRWLVERCLAKDPDERYVSTRDLARDLASVRDHISEVSSASQAALEARLRPLPSRLLPLLAAGFLLGVAAVGGWLAVRGGRSPAPAPSFQRLTFRSGLLNNARFSPDGQTVVYGAIWAGEPQRLYAVRPGSPESRAFDLAADILAISSSGEMAIQPEGPAGPEGLARVPFAGGAPRRVADHVIYAGADWSPDGKELAVVRMVEGRRRLEFPLGNVLYEGNAHAPRFSPRGDAIAFFEFAETPSVAVIPSSGGERRTVSAGWSSISGAPCWAPDGKEIWFTAAAEPGQPEALHAVDLAGKNRLVTRVPGFLELDDISRDGRLLLAHHTLIWSLWGLAPAESSERELTWLDSPVPVDLSNDGQTLLFNETGEAGGRAPAIYLRNTDGSPAVRLGEGVGLALSADEKWVIASVRSGAGPAQHLALVPTGAGNTRVVSGDAFEEIGAAAWLRDGRRVIFSARERGPAWHVYLLDLAGGQRRPISPQGVALTWGEAEMRNWGSLSPDGRWFLGRRDPNEYAIYPIEGGEPRPVTGLAPGDIPVRWSSEGHSIYVYRPREETGDSAATMWLLDPGTGERKPWREIRPADAGAVVMHVVMSADGKSYVYSTRRVASALYILEGVK